MFQYCRYRVINIVLSYRSIKLERMQTKPTIRNTEDLKKSCKKTLCHNFGLLWKQLSTIQKSHHHQSRKDEVGRNNSTKQLWIEYRSRQVQYSTTLKKTNKASWKKHCGELEGTTECVKFQKTHIKNAQTSIHFVTWYFHAFYQMAKAMENLICGSVW